MPRRSGTSRRITCGRALFRPRSEIGGAVAYPQVVQCGAVIFPAFGRVRRLPVDQRVRDIASRRQGLVLRRCARPGGARADATTLPTRRIRRPARALARRTSITRSVAIRTILFLIAFGGVALAVALGLIVAGAALAPVRRLTRATENVAETGNLSERIEVSGNDELSRLACSFNTMLGRARGVHAHAASARRRRFARAAHAADEPAHEHRGARERAGAAARRARAAPQRRDRTARRDDDAHRRADGARARRAARRPSPRRFGSTSSLRTPSSARGATVRQSTSRPIWRSRSSTEFRRRSSARLRTCSTTRPSGARRRQASRSACTTAR